MLKLNTTDINKVMLGSTEINKLMLGVVEIYSKGSSPLGSVGDYIIYALTTDSAISSTTSSKLLLDTDTYVNDVNSYSNTSGSITIKEAGTYMLTMHLAIDRVASGNAGSNRSSAETIIYVNGSPVSGGRCDTFIRRSNSADEASDCAFGIYEFLTDDVIDIYTRRINAAGSSVQAVGASTTYIPAKTSLTIVRLNSESDKMILEANTTDQLPSSVDTWTDVPWNIQTVLDTASFSHNGTDAYPIIKDIGRYLVTYCDSYLRDADTSTRTGLVARLELNGVSVRGSYSNNYIRGSQSGESILVGNNSCATIIETTSSNTQIKLSILSEAGTMTKTRIPAGARLCVYKLPVTTTSFKVFDSGSQNVTSTTDVTVVHTSNDWMDTGFSLASNQITVSDASRYLFLNSIHTDGSGTQRVTMYTRFRINGVDNLNTSGLRYCRNTGGMQKMIPTMGLVTTLTASSTVEIRSKSLSANGTNYIPIAADSSFCGLDLNTL